MSGEIKSICISIEMSFLRKCSKLTNSGGAIEFSDVYVASELVGERGLLN